jgi:hypothetical protein
VLNPYLHPTPAASTVKIDDYFESVMNFRVRKRGLKVESAFNPIDSAILVAEKLLLARTAEYVACNKTADIRAAVVHPKART